MKKARILGRIPNTSSLVVQDAEGKNHRYNQGKAIPQEAVERTRHGQDERLPTIAIHSDIEGRYSVADAPKFLFDYDGDELPRLLNIRDGSDTGYHEFHYEGLYVE